MAETKEKAKMPEVQKTEDATNVATAETKPLTDAEKIALADKKIEEDRIAELKKTSAAKILELNGLIAKADARKAKYEGDDEDTVATREFMQKERPNVWDNIQNDPAMLRKELADYKLSLLTPEEKEFATKWQKAHDDLAAATKAQTDLKAEILAKYPDFFGATKAAKTTTAKVAGTPKSDEVIEFTGQLLDLPTAKARVLALVSAGTTSETDIIKAIYGDNFTINNSKPRFQIHSIRVNEGLVAKKG